MSKNRILITLVLIFAIAFFGFAFAAPLYSPGETLDPNCLPSNADCTVTPAAESGANSDITSLSALVSATTTNFFTTNFRLSTLSGLLYGSNGTVSNITNGAASTLLQASSTSATGFAWVATSSLGITTDTSNFLTFSYASSTFALFGSSTQWITSGSNIYYNTGNVGVGTTSPASRLDIYGTSSAPTTDLFGVSSSSNSRLFTVAATGYVGIGTSTPTALISLPAGTAATSGINFGDGTANLYRSSAGIIKSDARIDMGSSVIGTKFLDSAGLIRGTNGSFMTIQGTNTYTAAGNILALSSGTFNQANLSSVAVAINPTYTQTGTSAAADLLIQRTETTLGSGLQYLIKAGTSTNDSLFTINNLGTGYFAGNVGISTTSPSARIDIYGTSSAPTTDLFGISSSSFSRFFTVKSTGRVGIGTSTPNAKLDVYGLSTEPTLDIFGVSSSSNSRLFTITSAGNVGVGSSTPISLLSVMASSTAQTSPFISFNSTTSKIFNVLTNGNVGIGTSTPSTPLYVIGSTTISSLNNAGFVKSTATGALYNDTNSYALAASGTQWVTSGANIYYSAGSVGIGTSTTPVTALDVFDDFNVSAVSGEFSATGGSVVESGGYRIHTFTSNDDFIPNGTGNIEYLLIAGGGGGGGNVGGGGGGGGYVAGSGSITAGTYGVVVGGGGAGAGGSSTGTNGSNSTFNGNTATGGGGGGGFGSNGAAGGSGGGGSGNNNSGGAGSQGGNGGTGAAFGDGNFGAGGGGGAGGNGANASNPNAGNGGVGYTSSISGASVTYAGGGGGGAYLTPAASAGTGTNGGGNGSAAQDGNGTNGTVNTGGGGGGAAGGGSGTGGTGGSGIVIIRYLTGQGSISSTFRVTSGGNIGISTTTPASKLDIYNSGTQDAFGVSSSSFARLFTITSAGNVGIGSSTPISLLSVMASSTAQTSPFISFNSTTSKIFNVLTNGNVGIGTSTPIANFSASGTIQFISLGSAGANLVTDSVGNVTVSSDERLKDIQGEYERGLADIMKINPIKFRWKDGTGYDGSNTYTGFSAQNILTALPEAVATGTSGFLSLADRPIMAALINAVKQIGSFITKIQGGIAYLKNIVVESIAVGSKDRPTGITMYDEATGGAYCVKIVNGILTNQDGACSVSAESTGEILEYVATVLDTEKENKKILTVEDVATTTLSGTLNQIITDAQGNQLFTSGLNISTTTISEELEIINSENSTSSEPIDQPTDVNISSSTSSSEENSISSESEVTETKPKARARNSENTTSYTENVSEVTGPVEQVIVQGAPDQAPDLKPKEESKEKEVKVEKEEKKEAREQTPTVEEPTNPTPEENTNDLQLGATVFGAELPQGALLAIVLFIQALMILGFGIYVYRNKRVN